MVQRVHHEALFLRADGNQVLAAVERQLADAGLPRHPFTHDGERVAGDDAVGRQIVGPIDVNRIDRRIVGELHQIDDTGRFHAHLLNILVLDHHPATFFELVPLDDLGVRHLAVAVRTPLLLLDPRLTLGVQLVERDGCR